MLNLVDVFWTFQGEGLHAGRRALFVRMPFCNLACDWCDTEFNKFEKWDETRFRTVAVSEPARFAVLTGGEPMLNKQSLRVIAILKEIGFEIATETNGTANILEGIDFVTVSPKRFAKGVRAPQVTSYKMTEYALCESARKFGDEFKYVVDDAFDFSVLSRHDEPDHDEALRYSLSPEFGNFHGNLARIQEFVSKNPKWRISLQTHKWMGVK